MNDVWKELEQETGKESTPNPAQSMQKQGETQTEKGSKGLIPEWLTYETGKKELPHYKDHSLNFNNSEWFGRILKGIDGLTQGKLANYWFFDVGIGFYQGYYNENGDKDKGQEKPINQIEDEVNED